MINRLRRGGLKDELASSAQAFVWDLIPVMLSSRNIRWEKSCRLSLSLDHNIADRRLMIVINIVLAGTIRQEKGLGLI